jgi:uncharacterized protein YeaO (DUF488 family)
LHWIKIINGIELSKSNFKIYNHTNNKMFSVFTRQFTRQLSTSYTQTTIPKTTVQRFGNNVSVVFEAKDTRQASDIINAIHKKNYVVHVKGGTGPGYRPIKNNNVFLL